MKFKVGDKVVIYRSIPYEEGEDSIKDHLGKVGTIVHIEESMKYPYTIEFRKNTLGLDVREEEIIECSKERKKIVKILFGKK